MALPILIGAMFCAGGIETKNDEKLAQMAWAIHLTGLFAVIAFYNLG